MKLPILAQPIQKTGSSRFASSAILPSGNNTQCCGDNCMTTYCFLGLSSKGCDAQGNPYINCIGG